VRDLLQLSILTASPTFCRRRSSSFRIRAASRAKKKKDLAAAMGGSNSRPTLERRRARTCF
jgi:hypothetical protein